jgi:hypothetical protein
MTITYKEPDTGDEITLQAEPEDYNGEQGLRIIFPSKDSFVIVQKDGTWNVVDDDTINPEIIEAIGKALHPYSRYNRQT